MKKIKQFHQFVNEDYSIGGAFKKVKDVFSKGINWVSDLISKIKSGFFRTIPSGPKKGLPMVAYFAYGEGNLLSQLASHFSNTKYSMMKESVNEAETGDISPYLQMPGAENVDSSTLKEMIIQKYEMMTTTTKVKKGGEEVEEGGYAKPIFIFGAPGIGKTEIVAQAAEELGVDLLFVDLQFMEPSDLLGIPSTIELASDPEKDPYGKGVTRSNPPTFLPRSNKGKNHERGGIVFLDEMNRAKSPVLNSMMQFLQQRRIQDYVLPSKWFIVAAGNRPSDDIEGVITPLGPAQLRRVDVVNYVPTVEGFETHIMGYDPKTGQKTGSYDYIPTGTMGAPLREVVLPELIAFLKFSKQFFHTLDPNKIEAQEAYATPAGWVDASKYLYSRLKMIEAKTGKREIGTDEIRRIFAMEVGQNAADAFISFYKLVKSFPVGELSKVYNDPQNAPIPSEKDTTDMLWAKLAAAASHVTEIGTITPEQFSNAVDWMIRFKDHLGPFAAEYASAFWTMLKSKAPYITKDIKYVKHLNKLEGTLFSEILKFKES